MRAARTREVRDGSARSPVIAGRGLAEIARLVQGAPRLRGRVRNSRSPDRGDARRGRSDGLSLRGRSRSCPGISFTIQVDNVDAKHRELSAAGISFVHPPMKVFWGYGA